jgi:hypothetical protein
MNWLFMAGAPTAGLLAQAPGDREGGGVGAKAKVLAAPQGRSRAGSVARDPKKASAWTVASLGDSYGSRRRKPAPVESVRRGPPGIASVAFHRDRAGRWRHEQLKKGASQIKIGVGVIADFDPIDSIQFTPEGMAAGGHTSPGRRSHAGRSRVAGLREKLRGTGIIAAKKTGRSGTGPPVESDRV